MKSFLPMALKIAIPLLTTGGMAGAVAGLDAISMMDLPAQAENILNVDNDFYLGEELLGGTKCSVVLPQ